MSEGARRFFDAIAGRYDRAYALDGDLSRARLRQVLARLPPAPARVLDLGVGTGRELTALLDAGHQPTGVDVSTKMLERCARRARPVPLICADFWAPLPLPDASFDAAIALHGTLAHPPEPAALGRIGQELGRVVRPGGVLVAEVPRPAWLDRLEELPALEDRSVRRTGPQSCVFEDHAVGASIEAHLLTEAQWPAALGPAWTTRLLPLGPLEWLVVSSRAG